MKLSKTHAELATSMASASASARKHRERVQRRVTSEWADYKAGKDQTIADLMDLVAEVTTRVEQRTLEGKHERSQADTVLWTRRKARNEASAVLRAALRDLKHILEAAHGKTAARHFLGIPDRLPADPRLLETAADGAVKRLRDNSIALPEGSPGLLLDRAWWAASLGEKLGTARQTRQALMNSRQEMIHRRDVRNREQVRLERQGRAAWLIFKGLLLFNDEGKLLEDLNSSRRPRGRAAETETPAVETMVEGQAEVSTTTSATEIPEVVQTESSKETVAGRRELPTLSEPGSWRSRRLESGSDVESRLNCLEVEHPVEENGLNGQKEHHMDSS